MNRQARYNNNSKVETHPVIGCTWFPWIFNKKRIKTKLAPPPPKRPTMQRDVLSSEAFKSTCMWKFPTSAMPKVGRRSDKCPEGSSSWEFHSKGREWNWQSPSDDVSQIYCFHVFVYVKHPTCVIYICRSHHSNWLHIWLEVLQMCCEICTCPDTMCDCSNSRCKST